MTGNGDILIRGADVVVTMDATRRELAGADVLLHGGVIAGVGSNLQGRGLAAGKGGTCKDQHQWRFGGGVG